MPQDIHIPPLQRDALLAMHHAPTDMLVRRGRVFSPAGPYHATSGTHPVQQFTKRLVLMLDRDGLVHLDDDEFPERVTLNAHGRQVAERLDAERQAREAAKAAKAAA